MGSDEMLKYAVAAAAALTFVVAAAPQASAQATRTWVSGVGDDANPCSRTAPCKTWAGAISKTAAGGEMDALDPGGFGAVTVVKSITFDGGGGVVASNLASGTNGMTINDSGAGTIVVIVRNLSLNGIVNTGSPGLSGISFASGAALIVEHCSIFGFGNQGINFVPTTAAKLSVSDTTIDNSGSVALGNGVLIMPGSGGSVVANLFRDVITNNNAGVRVDGSTAGAGASFVTIANSSISNNATLGVTSVGGVGATTLLVANDVVANNHSAGVTANGANATVTVGGSTVTNNSIGLRQIAGTFNSYGNNMSIGNVGGNDTAGTITPVTGH
jgi:hypothetical protein